MKLNDLCEAYDVDPTWLTDTLEKITSGDAFVIDAGDASPETTCLRHFLHGGTVDDLDIDLGGCVWWNGPEALVTVNARKI